MSHLTNQCHGAQQCEDAFKASHTKIEVQVKTADGTDEEAFAIVNASRHSDCEDGDVIDELWDALFKIWWWRWFHEMRSHESSFKRRLLGANARRTCTWV